MIEILSKLVPVAMLVFVIASMLAMGLSLTVREILAPLRNARLVLLALIANFVLMPLGAFGIARLLRLFAAAATRVKPALDKTSNLSLMLLITLLVVVNFDKMLDVFGTRGILAGIVFIFLGFAIGHLLGGPSSDTRRVLALGTSQRNIAAGLVVAGQNFSDPEVVLMVVVVAIVGLLILMPLSRALSRRA